MFSFMLEENFWHRQTLGKNHMEITKEVLRNQILSATKLRREPTKNVLKVVLGEVELQESRTRKPLDSNAIVKIAEKTIAGIDEMLKYRPNDSSLQEEKAALSNIIPAKLGKMDILFNIDALAIKAAKNEGQAIGLAIKQLKEAKLLFDSNDVKEVVINIRNAS